jgi:hypothetical protein
MPLILQFWLPTSVHPSSLHPSIHLRFGLPTLLLPSGLSKVIFLHGRLSCICTICPAHLSLVFLMLPNQSHHTDDTEHLYLVSLFISTLSSSQYIKAPPTTIHSLLSFVTPVWPYTDLCYSCMATHWSCHQYQYNICTLFSCVATFLWQLNSEDRDTVILQSAGKYLCSNTV